MCNFPPTCLQPPPTANVSAIDGSSVGQWAARKNIEVATAHERTKKQEPHKQNLQQLPHIIGVHYRRRYHRHNHRYHAEEHSLLLTSSLLRFTEVYGGDY